MDRHSANQEHHASDGSCERKSTLDEKNSKSREEADSTDARGTSTNIDSSVHTNEHGNVEADFNKPESTTSSCSFIECSSAIDGNARTSEGLEDEMPRTSSQILPFSQRYRQQHGSQPDRIADRPSSTSSVRSRRDSVVPTIADKPRSTPDHNSLLVLLDFDRAYCDADTEYLYTTRP